MLENLNELTSVQQPTKQNSPRKKFLLILVIFISILFTISLVYIAFKVITFFSPPKFTDSVKTEALGMMKNKYKEDFEYIRNDMRWNENGDHGFDMKLRNSFGEELSVFAQVEKNGKVSRIEESYGCYKFSGQVAKKYQEGISDLWGSNFILSYSNHTLDGGCSSRVSNLQELSKDKNTYNRIWLYVKNESEVNEKTMEKIFKSLTLLDEPDENSPLIQVTIEGKGNLYYSKNELIRNKKFYGFNEIWPLTLEGVTKRFVYLER